MVALTVLVLAAGAAVVWQATVLVGDRAAAERRKDALDVAGQQVLDLTSLESDTISDKIRAMEARTSGDFKNQLTTVSEAFIQLVQQKNISSEGVIVAAGLSSIGDDDATAIIATSTTVSQDGGEPINQSYRMRVKLVRSAGDWKVNGMEFVP